MPRLRTLAEMSLKMYDKLLESEFTVSIHSDSDYSKYVCRSNKKEDERERERRLEARLRIIESKTEKMSVNLEINASMRIEHHRRRHHQ